MSAFSEESAPFWLLLLKLWSFLWICATESCISRYSILMKTACLLGFKNNCDFCGSCEPINTCLMRTLRKFLSFLAANVPQWWRLIRRAQFLTFGHIWTDVHFSMFMMTNFARKRGESGIDSLGQYLQMHCHGDRAGFIEQKIVTLNQIKTTDWPTNSSGVCS